MVDHTSEDQNHKNSYCIWLINTNHKTEWPFTIQQYNLELFFLGVHFYVPIEDVQTVQLHC